MCCRGFKVAFIEMAEPLIVVDDFGCVVDFEDEPVTAGPSSSCAAAARSFNQRPRCWRSSCRARNSQPQPETFELQPGRRYFGHTPVDVVELPDGYTITVDVPGLTRERVIVLVDEDIIIVAGDYDGLYEHEDQDSRILRDERSGRRRTFERRFRLPRDVLGDAVAYDVQDGLLKVFLPKKFQVDNSDDNHMEAEEQQAGPSNTEAEMESLRQQWVDVLEDAHQTTDNEKEDHMSE